MKSRRGYYEETPEATALRRLFGKLYRHHEAHHSQVFMTTSSSTSEGKSTISAFLATVSARHRRTQTVLVDCDLRRPMVHELYELRIERGVADVLSQGAPVQAVLKPSAIPNLKIVTAGMATQSPAELFSSERLPSMFEQLRRSFEIILVDAPPLIPVGDSLQLSSVVEGILFVCKAGATRKRVAQHALELLEDHRDKLLGIVINNAKGMLPYYYDYKFYDYKYYRAD